MTFSDPEVSEVDETEETPKSLRQRLAREAAENERLRGELAVRDREVAFTKVGLPDTPMAEFFKSNYDGDSSEEAIRARAQELGLIGSPTAATNTAVEDIDQMSDAFAGGVPVMSQTKQDEMDRALKAIPPGPHYGETLERVLQEYGRPTRLDDT